METQAAGTDDRQFAVPGASMHGAATKRASGTSGTWRRGARLACRHLVWGGENMAFGLRQRAATVEQAIILLTAMRSSRKRCQQANGNGRHGDLPQQQYQAGAMARHRRVLIATAR